MSEEQQFAIQKIYLKDVSFESPNSPQSFTDGEWKPQVNVQINTANTALGDNNYEVVLEATVTAKQGENTAFLVEIKQAGVFTLVGFADEAIGGMLGAFCPETLFPYARESISELITKGGYPPVYLSPMNFTALYQQQLQQQAEAQDAAQDAAH